MNVLAKITVQANVNAPIDKVWEYYNQPEHVTKWNNASEDWHTTSANNNLVVGGSFNYRMEAKDGSAGFDFDGTYDEVEANALISYTMGDGRKVTVKFDGNDEQTHIEVAFDPEDENTPEMQREGWQAILDSFKKYVEAG